MRHKYKANRLLSVLLSVILVLTMLPSTVWAAGDHPELQSATVTSAGDVELKFDMEMADPSSDISSFRLRRNDGVVQTLTSVGLKSGDSTIIELIPETKIKGGYVFDISYNITGTPPGTVQSSDGKTLETISYHSVTNDLPHPTITEETLPVATLGISYSYNFNASGGSGSYYFSKDSGNLPLGLSLNSAGILSGTPTTYSGTYEFWVRVTDVDGAIDRKYFGITVNSAGDTTPPTFAILPQNNPQASGSRQVYIYATAEEPAYYHAVIVADGDNEPTKEQVAAGQDASGNAALRVFSSSTKSTNITVAGFVPLHSAEYDVYIVLKDDAGNLSEPAKVDFPSPPPADLLADSYPQIGDAQPGGSKQVQIKVKIQNINIDRKGKVYWVLLPDSAAEPCIEQIAAGTDGDDNVAVTSGNPEFSPGNEMSFLVTGAAGETKYDLYMVVGDTLYAAPLARCTDVIKLVVTTPANIPEAVLPARIAAGSGFSLYLKEDGTVWAWGGNSSGQLGRGTTSSYSYDVPAQVTELSNVKSIAAGHVFSLALKNDGTVWAWGTNGNGQLGLPHTATYYSATPVQVGGLSGIQAISAGYRFCLALDANGDVWAWGNNAKGQLGQPATETIHTPGKISGLSDIIAISAGYMHSLALDSSGRVWAWGSNYFGELGNGTVDAAGNYPVPSQVLNTASLNVARIYAAFQNSMLITDTGAVYGWGYNSKGSLGDGTSANRSIPTPSLSSSNITALGGTGAFYITLKGDGTVWASGENNFSSEIIYYGASPVPVNGLAGITAISQGNGGNHALALDSTGAVWAWGSNTSEECGQNTDYYGLPKKIDPPAKVQFPGGDISAASVTIALPVAGGTPQTAAQVQAATNHIDYTVTGLTWNEAMTAEGKFKAEQTYTTTVTLTSKNGNKFQSTAFTPTVAGAASVGQTVTSGSSTGNTVTFTVTYGQTAVDPDSQAVADAKEALTFNAIKGSNTAENNILSNLNLTTSGINGTSISWSSDKPASISASGTVDRPAHDTSDQTVILTATINKGSASDTKIFILTVKKQLSASTPSEPGSRDRGGSTPPPVPQLTAQILDSTGKISSTLTATLDSNTGTVKVEASSDLLTDAFNHSKPDWTGLKMIQIDIPEKGAKVYTSVLPASFLGSGDTSRAIEMKTELVSVTVLGSMLEADDSSRKAQAVTLAIAAGDKSRLDAEVRKQIGNRPLIMLELKIDGRQVSWNNENAPVTVSIPYSPTAAELLDPEHIVIWYIDGSGNPVSVPSGRYDPDTGTVTFTTTHFSGYAIAYVKKTFTDLNGVKWAKNAIEVMASKGIVNGTGKDAYSPAAGITRADFMVMLVKTLGLTAKYDQNFTDVSQGAYYYDSLGIAREMGIATGSGDNRFRPKEKISRQDMMVLTARALEKSGRLKTDGTSAILDQFSDRDVISGYASERLAALIKGGLVTGSGNKLNPRGNTTRAEAAVFLHRIYNQ